VGTGTNGCSNKATVSQNVGTCTGLNEPAYSAAHLEVYPNPSSGGINFEIVNGLIDKIIMSDASGRVVMHSDVNGAATLIDVSDLSNGVYYANVISSEGNKVIRIIKN
jgi:hypothetical protein